MILGGGGVGSSLISLPGGGGGGGGGSGLDSFAMTATYFVALMVGAVAVVALP
ncbi:hypothetical protein GCM10028809_69730 [Spirosoma gilvum]